jgi:uncharacterized protein
MTSKDSILTKIRAHKAKLNKLGVRNIGLFGSYVKGEQSDKSDIDILIDFEPDKENYSNFMAVYDLIERLFEDERIEIVTRNGLSPYIGPIILSEVVYA